VFNTGPAREGFLVDSTVLGQGFIPVLGVSPVITILLVLLTGISRRYHRRCVMSTFDSFGDITVLCPRSFMVIIHHSKMYRLYIYIYIYIYIYAIHSLH